MVIFNTLEALFMVHLAENIKDHARTVQKMLFVKPPISFLTTGIQG